MNKILLSALFAASALLTLPGPSSAQYPRSYYRYGNSGGVRFSLSVGSPGYYGYRPYYRSGYTYPRASYYTTPSSSSAYSYYSTPAYSDPRPAPVARSSYYDAAVADTTVSDAEYADTAYLEVTVPPDAELWFNGVRSVQSGSVRTYVSPPLDPGRTFNYEVRARWTDVNGEPVDLFRTIKVWAGARLAVDFLAPYNP